MQGHVPYHRLLHNDWPKHCKPLCEFESARDTYPGIDLRIVDAADLAFDDETFDAVISNFGIIHFARPERFLDEALRVVRAGGNIAFTEWRGAQHKGAINTGG